MSKPTSAESPAELDPNSWVDRYGDDLYRYALSRLRSEEAAEEVVQQTFVAAWKHVDQYAGRGSVRGWMLGILKRKIVDLIRQRNRTTSLTAGEGEDRSDDFFDADGNWNPEVRSTLKQSLDSLEQAEFWEILHACLETLPTRQADAFALREMDEQSTGDICKVLGVSPSNLWVLLHRARLRLSQCMKTRWHQESR